VAAKFFDEQSEQSEVKTAVVAKYFIEWARVITGFLKNKEDRRIAYIDLFAGPGRYKDGVKSTPLFILEMATREAILRENLVAVFNDKDPENTSSLLKEMKGVHGINGLKHKPVVYTSEVGEEIVKMFEHKNLIPTLFFVDPWGYKGLSLRLINSVLKDWACECIFFFNYNRINMGLPNEAVDAHMNALFGEVRADVLRARIRGISSHNRELTIIEEICEALVEMGGKYVLPFRFKNKAGTRTSHHLVFVSKHPLGYKIMKRVMANESSSTGQGVASFEYNPATAAQPLLFGLLRSLDELEELLLDEFAGRTLSMMDVFNEHNLLEPNSRHNYMLPFTDKNYKDVLTNMEQAGKITGNPPFTHRPKRKGAITCADATMFTFPKKQAQA
jgi:three-Cys-motif partner protein